MDEADKVTNGDLQKIATLRSISGLELIMYKQSGMQCFQFVSGYSTLATVCTYKKAKLFAEGVKLGRELATNHN